MTFFYDKASGILGAMSKIFWHSFAQIFDMVFEISYIISGFFFDIFLEISMMKHYISISSSLSYMVL